MRGTPSTSSPARRIVNLDPAMDPDAGRDAGAARIAALAEAATGAAGARTPEELAGVLRRACAVARPCEGFRFATYDAASDTLRYLTAFPALAAGDDETGWHAVRERRPQTTEPRDGAPAVLSAPAMADGEALGVLVTTAAAGFHPDDEKMAEALAAIAGGALARLRLAREHRGAKDAARSRKALEQRVEERTRELAHANDALAAEVQQHRAAREELLHRTLELEVIFGALPDLYFRLGRDGTILSYRAGAHNALYVEPELFLNRRMQDVLPPEVGAKFEAAAAQLRATGHGATMEYTLPFPGGELGHFEARLVPLVADEMAAVVRDITARKSAEAALRESEESYRGLFDRLTELVYIQDLEGRFLNVNDAVLRTYGYTREELLGRTPEILADAKVDIADTMARFQRAVAGEPQRFEWWGRRKDGSVFPKELSLARSTYFGQDAVIAVGRDITERVEAEDALRRSEGHFRRLIENGQDTISIVDPSGAMTYMSPSSVRMLGYTPEELVGRPTFDFVHPDDQARVAAEIGRVFATPGYIGHVEYRFRHRDGSWRYLEAVGQTLSPDSPDEGLVANTRDITERKTAEDALRHSESHFRRMIGNAQDNIVIVDTSGVMTYQSPSSIRVTGYLPEELVGKSAFAFIHPDDAEPTARELARTFANPGYTGHAEYRFLHKDGTWHWHEAFGQTLAPDSADEGLVANVRDTTERRLAEEGLRRATAEAEAANRAKSEFLSRMSHELRTPMNSILGFAQLLERAALPDSQRRGVQHILTAGRHLLRLINEVLDIARIESGRQQLSLEPVRLAAVLQEAMALARPLAAQGSIVLSGAEVPEDAVFVRADRQRLVQVLLNLLSNAIKYNRPGGVVRLGWERIGAGEGADPRVRLRVLDTGVGIAPEKLDQLFVPFARLGAEFSDVEGTGLGLALSRRLVEAMGGELVLERSDAEGSSFAVELRLSRDPVEGLSLRTASPDAAPAPQVRTPVTLLYVEDNLANLSLVETILASRPGWRTIPALQGRLGAELACEHAPDLVLLDLHLPDVQGDEVLRRLRADPRTARIPVVMISADATPRTIDRLRAEGADAYLTKPLDVDEFLATIDRLLPEPAATA